MAQMCPPNTTVKAGSTISHEAFDDLGKENMDDLRMDPTEGLQDAIQTLTLQGVDLSAPISQNPHFSRYPPFDRSGRKSFNKDDGEVEAGVSRERKKEKKKEKSMREKRRNKRKRKKGEMKVKEIIK